MKKTPEKPFFFEIYKKAGDFLFLSKIAFSTKNPPKKIMEPPLIQRFRSVNLIKP